MKNKTQPAVEENDKKRWLDPKQKAIMLYIPRFIFDEIEELQPFLGNTTTATIIRILERGIAYYQKTPGIKKALQKKESQQTTEQDNPHENNRPLTEEEQRKVDIAKTRWVD